MLNNVYHPVRSFFGVPAIVRLILFFAFLASVTSAETSDPKHVFILMQEDISWPASRLIDENARAALPTGFPGGILVFSEYLDRVHFPDPQFQAQQVAGIQRKYANSKLDPVIGVGDVPTDLFPGVPLLYMRTDPSQSRPIQLASSRDTVNLWIELDARKTLNAARRLQPNARQVAVIGSTSPTGKNLLNQVRDQINRDSEGLSTVYLEKDTFDEIRQKVSTLNPGSIVLFVTRSRDAGGRQFITAEVISQIAAVSGAPVYVLLDTHVGTGAMGGCVVRFAEMGKRAGELGVQMLAGQHPQDEAVRSDYLFDWRQLSRWKISESALPAGSVVLYRQASLWESYKYYVLGAILLCVVETLLILGLLWQRASRRKFEQSLLERVTFQKMLSDLSDRKRAEQLLRESEERFRLVANSAPVLIWMSGTDKLCNFFNQCWLDFTGRKIEDELGEGWVSSVHPEDVQRCLGTYSASFNARVDFEMEYRLRRFDGEYRWMVDYGVPRFESDGTFCGYIGSCVDITERKSSAESLQALTGRLIHIQEEERTRIARELHDDFSQRLALQCIDIEQLRRKLPEHEVEERDRLSRMLKRARTMSSDIRSLSHELHSSRLDYIGLVPAISGLCKEIGEKYKIAVQFAEYDRPADIPKDVALCLFRVAQEALGNVVKHSQARTVQVELGFNSDGVSLRIIDDGSGFDPNSTKLGVGLGLVGMSERLRLVGGRLSIRSEHLRGAEILAEVPLSAIANESRVKAVSAAGRES